MDIERLLETAVGGLGYELVGWERFGRAGLLRLFVDKPAGINVDDCARISEHLSHLLAVEGIDYGRLEVSSPGLDRMLRKESDFVRFAGQKARVRLRVAIDGQRNFVGRLRMPHEGKMELEVDGRPVTMDLSNIEKARLVPNI